MKKTPVLRISGTEAPPGMDEVFNKWYNDPHIADVMRFGGMDWAMRWKLRREQTPPLTGVYPTYLTTYQWESPEASARWRTSPEQAASAKDFADNFVKKGARLIWFAEYDLIQKWTKD